METIIMNEMELLEIENIKWAIKNDSDKLKSRFKTAKEAITEFSIGP